MLQSIPWASGWGLQDKSLPKSQNRVNRNSMAENTRYCFEAEWFDVHAQLFRKYEFFFYPSDHTIEMVISSRVSDSSSPTP